MQKVILFYKFVPVQDPETVMHWQRALCEKLGLKGRIIISQHGINGTLGGDFKALKMYTRTMVQHTTFKGIAYKWSDSSVQNFPKLSVKVRDEIVTFGVADKLVVDEHGIVDGGKHLKPEQVHQLVAERGDDVVFFDGRNSYEAKIGKFKNAIVPNTRTAKDFERELDTPEMVALKNKPVVTYCTGGIRCEVLSSLMIKRGFKEVYQMDGGIVKYGEKYKDDGLWEGRLFVFDGRMSVPFSDKAKDIGHCVHCNINTSRYVNCANKSCNELILVCKDCDPDNHTTCSTACAKILLTKSV